MPYSIGLQAAANAFLSAGFATQFTVAVIALLSILLITSAFQKDAPDAPVSLPGLSLSHIMPFYKRRFDFLSWGIHATGQSMFQFKLLRNTVIVISGESGRQAFFSAKGLDLTEGFKILSGAIPSVSGVTTDLQSRRIATIHKRVTAAQREGHLSILLPHLLEDSRRVMERWGTSGRFDPFEKIYELTFQTTIRALSCGEIADDHVLVSRIKRLYDKLDTGTTPTTILMPWLPSWTMASKLWSTKEIYDIIVAAVKQRQELLERIGEGEKPQDTMQLLLDAGDDRMAVVGFIMGLLIAGARATGTSASWLITFLASHPEWARKARAEVEDLVTTHTNVRFPSSPTTAAIPVSWPPSSPTPVSVSSPITDSWPPLRPTILTTNFPAAVTSPNSPIMSTLPVTSIRTPASPLAPSSPSSLLPVSANSIPSPTIPTAWSSRRQSYQSYPYYPGHHHHQRRDSQSSTATSGTTKNKRKRCNSGSGSDGDSSRKIVGSRRGSLVVRKGSSQSNYAREKVGFPESDEEKEKETEERLIGGPVSLLGDGSGRRRRKDAITRMVDGLMNASSRPDGLSFDTAEPVLAVAPVPTVPTVPTPSPLPSSTPSPSPPPSHAPTAHTPAIHLPTPAPPPSISDALNQIPLSSWENPSCTPILDALIKETLRVAQPHTAMRRNVGPEFYIDGKRIETGDYVVYPFSDVHLDEGIYENASAWMPERWLNSGADSDEEKGARVPGRGVPFEYVGWGGGKSICLGTRLAKVELKLIVSMFVLGFDLDIVNKKGNRQREAPLPQPNWNDILLCKPEKKFWMGFERREGLDL